MLLVSRQSLTSSYYDTGHCLIDTCIHHMSTDMLSTELHIYHSVCSLLRRHAIDISTNMTAWKTTFFLVKVLTRTVQAATLDLVALSTQSHGLFRHSAHSLFFFSFSVCPISTCPLKKMASLTSHRVHNPWPLQPLWAAEVWWNFSTLNEWRGQGRLALKGVRLEDHMAKPGANHLVN